LKVLLEGIKINEEKIKENLSLSRGLILSSRALFELVLAGMPREKAYKLVQKASFDVVEGKESDFTNSLLKTLEKEDKKIAEKVKDKLTDFSLKYKDEIFDRVLSLPVEVKIKKQKDVFDPEGKAIADNLRKLGYKVKEVRVGKIYEVKIKDGKNDFIEKVLVNPIVEDYEINLKE
jgi:adenylosuccinate lyase